MNFSTNRTNKTNLIIMEKIWIIGIGQFGTLAYRRLSKSNKERHFVLVDPLRENLLQCDESNTTLEEADGIDFLEKHLDAGNKPDWIIPALPVHLAAEWFLVRLGTEKLRRIPLPPNIDLLLPNPIRGPEGNIYVSHAEFRCPDDCAEPRDICTVTGKPRKKNMFEILGDIQLPPFQSLNIRSHQLGPGIGGYRADHLLDLLAQVEQARGHLLVSTACRCHGVITGLERL
ncbi:MAG: potassium transporter [Pseudomonadota bacterium]